jgi:polyisoprenoid-binding protein YceI
MGDVRFCARFFSPQPERRMTMRQLVCAMVLTATVLSGSALAGGTFTLDPKNTKIEFTGTKPGGKHNGGFKTLTGTASGADATSLKLDVEIDTTSIYTDTAKLTTHLKSADFFEVATYPKAKFVSTKVEKAKDGYTVTGDLTLHGKTKSISFPASITVGADAVSLTSTFKINRQDFGISYGPGKVDDDVTLKVAVKATK